MRKILMVMVVLFITAQAYAGTVTLSVVDEGAGWASIRYSADANVSAFGLKVTADSGAVITDINDYNVGECTATVKGYGIFPGTIVINESNGVVTSDGTPVAPNTAPGAAGTGLNTNTLILEMGALYVEGNEPDLSGTLIKVQVDGDCNVCVEGEPIRGNVVLTNADEATLSPTVACGFITVTALCTVPDVVGMLKADADAAIIAADFVVGTITESYSDTVEYGYVISQNPTDGGTQAVCGTAIDYGASLGSDCYLGQPQADIDEWIAVGRPVCWCYPRQCHGDADGLPYGKDNYWVSTLDLTIMKDAWNIPNGPVGAPGACADFDHLPYGKDNYRVSTLDLTILKNNWNIPNGPAGDCSPGNRTP